MAVTCWYDGRVLVSFFLYSIVHTIIKHTFKSYERLKSKKLIEQLFKQGRVVHNLYPLRLIYLPCQKQPIVHHQVLFSIPKKKIKHAVDRNIIKRRIKEAYRLHKHLLHPPLERSFHFLLAYIYIPSDNTCTFESIEKQIIQSIHYLNEVIVPTANDAL